MGVPPEPLKEPVHLLVNHCVARHPLVEIGFLRLGRQLAIKQEVAGLQEIAALGQLKANTDSGIFTAIQFAARDALDQYATLTPPIRSLYQQRRDAFLGALRGIGWDVPTPGATSWTT